MQAIPAKLQANLLTYGCHITEEVNRSAGGKQQHTRDSRTNHYLKWYKRMGGEGDPVMPQAPIQVSSSSLSPRLHQLTSTPFALSPQARNYVLACYAVSLVRGETILNIRIRYKTLKNYLNAAIKLHTQRSGHQGGQKVERLPNPYNAKVDYIDIVLKAVRKYEAMPNRREVIYDKMVAKMLKRQANLSPDSVKAALID